MKTLGLITLGIAFCVFYGVFHNQTTARVCVEYFTIGHPPIFGTNDSTTLAIG